MKILVPVEDVLSGSAIIDALVKHQWPEDTEFRVINIVDPFFLDYTPHVSLANLLQTSEQGIIGTATAIVEGVAGSLKKFFPKACVSQEVIRGHVKDEIVSLSKQWHADLIVAGSHGRTGFDRFLLGSVSLMLLSEAPCPVLLVKPDEKTLEIWDRIEQNKLSAKSLQSFFSKAYSAKTPRKILIAVDETALSHQTIDFVIKHAWTQPAHFKILTVVRQPNWLGHLHVPGLSEIFQDSIQARKSALRTLALKLRDFYHSTHIEEELIIGDPKQVIAESAKKWEADLIIVGCHMREPAQRAIVGSVALATLCTAPCATLLLKQPSAERADAAAGLGEESLPDSNSQSHQRDALKAPHRNVAC